MLFESRSWVFGLELGSLISDSLNCLLRPHFNFNSGLTKLLTSTSTPDSLNCLLLPHFNFNSGLTKHWSQFHLGSQLLAVSQNYCLLFISFSCLVSANSIYWNSAWQTITELASIISSLILLGYWALQTAPLILVGGYVQSSIQAAFKDLTEPLSLGILWITDSKLLISHFQLGLQTLTSASNFHFNLGPCWLLTLQSSSDWMQSLTSIPTHWLWLLL